MFEGYSRGSLKARPTPVELDLVLIICERREDTAAEGRLRYCEFGNLVPLQRGCARVKAAIHRLKWKPYGVALVGKNVATGHSTAEYAIETANPIDIYLVKQQKSRGVVCHVQNRGRNAGGG